MGVVIGAVVVAIVVVGIIVIAVRRRRGPDTVASFRRQIDALSSEARRPVVDQVTQLERDDEQPVDGEDENDEPRDGS